MTARLREMCCYILAGGKSNVAQDFVPVGELTRLETGYRRYAALFELVKLVIKEEQAREHYLNYPHVIDSTPTRSAAVGVATALADASSDFVFVGSSDIVDFPLRKAVELIRNYNGEAFLGYASEDGDQRQFLFGIYNKKALSRLSGAVESGDPDLALLMKDDARLLPAI